MIELEARLDMDRMMRAHELVAQRPDIVSFCNMIIYIWSLVQVIDLQSVSTLSLGGFIMSG